MKLLKWTGDPWEGGFLCIQYRNTHFDLRSLSADVFEEQVGIFHL